jgi:hypothetical protein
MEQRRDAVAQIFRAERHRQQWQHRQAELASERADRGDHRRSTRTEHQDLAFVVLGREHFHHLAGFDATCWRSDDDEIGGPRIECRAQGGELRAFAGRKAEAFQCLDQEGSRGRPGLGDAGNRHCRSPA